MIDEVKEGARYKIAPLAKRHDKSEFKCNVAELDHYLKTQAGQDIKKKVAVTHVITAINSEKVLGFYSLSSIGIFPGDLPDDIVRKLPRYPVLPGVLIGRLAVDANYRGHGLGVYLLMDALRRSIVVSHHIGIVAVIVDAKNEKAISFYKQYGFIELPDNSNRLFLSLSTVKQLEL